MTPGPINTPSPNDRPRRGDHLPKPLSEIAAIADNEGGLDYAISQDMIVPEDFEDESLAKACQQAKDGLKVLAVIWDAL